MEMSDLPGAPLYLLGLQHLGKLAREVAMNVRDLEDVLKDYNLTPDQYESFIAGNDHFKEMLQAAVQEWNSALSTPDRIRVEAAQYLEEQLPLLAAAIGAVNEPLSGRAEVAKLLAKLADIGETSRSGESGGKFSINIHLGEEKTVTIEGTTEIQSLSERSSEATALLQNSEGLGEAQEMEPLTETETCGQEVQPSAEGTRAYEALLALSERISNPVPQEPLAVGPGAPTKLLSEDR
jgi:hypothetical protein